MSVNIEKHVYKTRWNPILAVQLVIGSVVLILIFIARGFLQVNQAHANPAIIYVDAVSGQDTEVCGTESNPCRSISFTLDNHLHSNDTILVARGTYTENLTIEKPVTLKGGYEALGWTRDITQYETIIDGNRTQSVVAFRIGSDEAVLDGFTLTAGESNLGGGILIRETSPTITNNTIISNTGWVAGGGIYLKDSSSRIAGNRIVENKTSVGGGGMEAHTSTATVEGNIIQDNVAPSGGGIKIWDSTGLTIENNTITSNRANDGGGILVVNSSPSITNNDIISNTAFWGGGIHIIWNSSPLIEGNTISDNSATDYGGGIRIAIDSSPTVKDNVLSNNISSNYGGAIDVWNNSAPLIYENSIANNVADQGGGISIWHHSSPRISVNAFEHNTAYEKGGAIWKSYTSEILDQEGNPISDPDTLNTYSGNTPDEIYIEPEPSAESELIPGEELHVPVEYPTIQAAIDSALDGDSVIVSHGTYTENITFYGKNITVRSEDPENPDSVQSTIIDGGRIDTVVSFENGETSGAVLSGFTIRNGLANYLGGGILIRDHSNPTVSHNTIIQNEAGRGGGIGCWNSTPKLIANTITGNTVDVDGGAIAALHGCHATFQNNTISDNSVPTGFGGGMFITHSSPLIESNIFNLNTASGMGGAIFMNFSSPRIISNTITSNQAVSEENDSSGGAIASDIYSSPVIEYNVIRENESLGGHAGGIYLEFGSPEVRYNIIEGNVARSGGGVMSSLYSSGTIERNIIQNNLADDGGGLSIGGFASPDVRYNDISNNTANLYGGAITVFIESPVSFDGNILSDNRAGILGGGISCWESYVNIFNTLIYGNDAAQGGGLWCDDVTINIINSTITGNSSSQNANGFYCDFCTMTITNSIFWSNDKNDLEIGEASSIEITYSDIEQGWSGAGNISSNPLFIDPINGDYHLRLGSPCIDAGIEVDLYTDFEEDLRPFDGDNDGIDEIDIGADEWVGSIWQMYLPAIYKQSG